MKKKTDIKPITKQEKKWIKQELLNNEKSVRLQQTIEKHSNFINLNQGYFNKGKYKGISVDKTPITYLKWVLQNIELNTGETKLITKLISK
jgi:hypothetical protein